MTGKHGVTFPNFAMTLKQIITQHKTFVLHLHNVGPTLLTLYKCYTNVFFSLGKTYFLW